MRAPAGVRVIRSGLDESIHRVDVAVVDASGALVAWAGDPARTVFARSSMKPLQAAVSVSLCKPEFGSDEIAVMCGSHNAEAIHIEAVRSVLAKAGVPESALQCPAKLPWDEQSALEQPTRMAINSDCSGKHAGMLAATSTQTWDLSSYRQPDHPLQQRILSVVLAAASVDRVVVGVDGCGVPVHGLPLQSMAAIYAGFSEPARWDALTDAVGRVVSAMRTNPYLVAGRNRVDTALMESVDALIVKGGAEGLICAAGLQGRLGVAVKVRDGSARAAGPALIRTLQELGFIHGEVLTFLADFARPPVIGGDQRVGELIADFELSRA